MIPASADRQNDSKAPSMNASRFSQPVRLLAIALASGLAIAQPSALPAPPTPTDVPTPADPGLTEKPIQPETSPPATASTPASAAVPKPPVLVTSVNEKPGSEFFVKAAAAVKRAQAIMFDVNYRATGGMETYSSAVAARVAMLRDATASGQTNGWMVRSTGEGTPKPGAEKLRFDVAWMGTPIEFVTHTEKKVVEKRNSRDAKSQAFSIANSARLTELFALKPFNRELLASADYAVLDNVTIGGVECTPVEVTFGERKGKSVWYFATSDSLPRKYVSVISNEIMSGTTEIELSNFSADESRPPKLSISQVRVEVPEGYTQDRPPAPLKPAATSIATAQPEAKGEFDLKKPGDNGILTSSAPAMGGEGVKPQSHDASGISVTEIPAPAAEKIGQPAVSATSTPATGALLLQEGHPFELKASTGGTISLQSLKDNIIIIEFGGSWCLPCRESRAELDLLATEFKDKPVRILALSVRDKATETVMERFRAQSHPYPLLVDADEVAQAYNVHAYPSYYVLDGNFQVLSILAGYTKDITIPEIKVLVQEKLGSLQPAAEIK